MLQPAAEAAGLGRVTWHQFRHIHSSLLNDLKVPVKIAQEQLGHASISTTLNIYTHVVDAHIARQWKRSKSGCLANWTQMVPNWRSCRERCCPKCAECLE